MVVVDGDDGDSDDVGEEGKRRIRRKVLTPAWLHVPVDRSLRYAYKKAHKFGSTG